jgi:hypothetical protein
MRGLTVVAKEQKFGRECSRTTTWGKSNTKLFPIESFIDFSNIEASLKSLDRFDVDYGALLDIVSRRYSERLGIRYMHRVDWAKQHAKETGEPVAYSKKVWGVASVPDNHHREDNARVEKYKRFLGALRRRKGFDIQEIPLNFHGYHVRRKDRHLSSNESERCWHPREKCVDIALAMRLLRRCVSPDAPAGVILWTGDADLSIALYDVVQNNPHISAMVAGFENRLSNVYWDGGIIGYSWPFPPIILDDCLAELHPRTGACQPIHTSLFQK